MMEVVQRSRFRVAPYQYYARTGSGHTPSRGNDEYWIDCDVPWVTTADVKHLRDGRAQVLNDTEHQISRLGLANSAARLHPAGTVVLSRTASVGFSAIMNVPMATSQDFVTWSPGDELDSRFFLWVLRAMKGTGDLDSLMYGSTHKTIYVPDVQQLRGPLPPLDVQRRIADYLDTETGRIDTLIAKNEHAATLVAERRTAVVTHGVEGAGPLRPLRYCLRNYIGGVWGAEPGEHEADVQVIRAADFDRVHHELTVARAPTRSVTRVQLDSRRLRPGDLVLEKSGGGDTQPVGCVGIFRGADEPCVPSNFNALLRPRNDVHVDYLNVACAAMYRSGESRQYINQTTGIQNIDVEAMMGHLVPVPPMRAQRAIAAKVSEEWANLDRVQGALYRQIELLRERRQALIAAAITGELEP